MNRVLCLLALLWLASTQAGMSPPPITGIGLAHRNPTWHPRKPRLQPPPMAIFNNSKHLYARTP